MDRDQMTLIITSLDVKGSSPTPRIGFWAPSWSTWDSPSRGFLHVYLPICLYPIQTDVGITSWTHPTSRVPQGGTEGPFLFLLVTPPLAF